MSIFVPQQKDKARNTMLNAFPLSAHFSANKQNNMSAFSSAEVESSSEERDKKGVFALSVISSGEQRLHALMEKAQQKGIADSSTMLLRAQEEVDAITGSLADEETSSAVKGQLQKSLDAFAVRSKDLALRSYLQQCDEQLQTKRQGAGILLEGLADTYKNAPSQDLRQAAREQILQQVNALRKAEKAIGIAKQRFFEPSK